ncbi:MAG: ABC transporter substrate-binding protein [Actinobacteria bacterium]|nr:ABC transporter substrate-binding protein [Actinomycetota bacterium]
MVAAFSLYGCKAEEAVEEAVPAEEEAVEEAVPAEEEAAPSKGVVTVLGTWGGDELTNFQEAVFPFTDETGIGMAFEGTRDLAAVLTIRVEAGNPPDLAILPNPGQMYELAKDGRLIDVSQFMNMEELNQNYAQAWLDLASYNGTLYGIFYKVANKSLIWYNPSVFSAAGYEIPTTWDELIALSDQIVSDGSTPWAIGFESGPASGWPATDWIEDIMLRTAGPDIYDQWVNHEISWTDEAVKNAWEVFGGIVGNEEYQYGGSTGTLTTNFGDAPASLFTSPPGAYMHRQASFITGFFPEGLVAGNDYDFFPFPSIDPAYGIPVLGGADLIVVFNNTPEVQQLVKYLATAQPQEIWAAKGGGFISPNKAVSLDAYPDELTRKMAEMVVNAEVFRFDASDLMPAAVGSGSFWTGTLDYVGGEDLDTVLEEIEDSAVDAQ